jgi:hypothetical protein
LEFMVRACVSRSGLCQLAFVLWLNYGYVR